MISDCASEPFIQSANLFKILISWESRVVESLTQQICSKMRIHSQTLEVICLRSTYQTIKQTKQ